MLIRFAAAIVLLFAATSAASAQTPTRVEVYQDWGVYTYTESGGSKVCYAASVPTDPSVLPPGRTRGLVYFLLSTRPSQGIINEASIRIGYTFATDYRSIVTIDGTDNFTFFTQGDNAWIDAATVEELRAKEAQLVTAMRRGLRMTVKGQSQFGTETSDGFSLRGISAALDRAAQECR